MAWAWVAVALPLAAQPRLDAVVDAAALDAARPLAAGAWASAFGAGLAPRVEAASSVPFPASLAGTRVLVGGVPAALSFVAPGQINFQVPFGAALGSAEFVVESGGVRSAALARQVVAAAPALFTLTASGAGPPAVLRPDGSRPSPAAPVRPGEILLVFANGLGPVDRPQASGAAAGANPLARLVSTPTVLFDGAPAEVLFAGLAPGFASLYQLNVRAPDTLTKPFPEVSVRVGAASSNAGLVGGPAVLSIGPTIAASSRAVTLVLRGFNFSANTLMSIANGLLPGRWTPGEVEEFAVDLPDTYLGGSGFVLVTAVEPDATGAVAGNFVRLDVALPDSLSLGTQEISLNPGACASSEPAAELEMRSSAPAPAPFRLQWSGAPWLDVEPREGLAPENLLIRVNPAGLAPGVYTADVNVDSAFIDSAAARFTVRMTAGSAPPPPVVSERVYVLDSMLRTLRDDPLPAQRETSARLLAAQGETQSFQIVAYGGSAGLQNVDAFVSTPLVGPNCAEIPVSAVRFYREHYVTVTNPSAFGLAGGRAGAYPDALIPFRNPHTGARLAAGAPFAVAMGRKQPVYVEISVPEGTPPGVYAGRIRLTQGATNAMLAEVPVELRVANFRLPREMSLRTQFQPFDASHTVSALPYFGYTANSLEHQSVALAIDEMLIEHRAMPEAPLGARLSAGANGALAANADPGGRLEALLARPEYTGYSLPFTASFPVANPLGTGRAAALRYLREAYDWFAARGFLDKLSLRQFDEPRTPADYAQVRDFTDLIHEANPNLQVAITDVFSSPYLAQYLHGRIDIYIMGAWIFDPVAAAARQAAGDEVWTYQTLAQNRQRPSPYWLIDSPLYNHRVHSWINFRYGLTGLGYWASDLWRDVRARGASPWSDPCTFLEDGACYNGDGMLVYPGSDIGLRVPVGAYGARSSREVWGVAPSLRLKAIRDGLQDFEWLTAAARIDANRTQQIVLGVACDGVTQPGTITSNCFYRWNTDPASLTAARQALADILEGR